MWNSRLIVNRQESVDLRFKNTFDKRPKPGLRWVKIDKTHSEQMFSAPPPEADLPAIPICRSRRRTPFGDMDRLCECDRRDRRRLGRRSLRGWIVEKIEEIVTASDCGFERQAGVQGSSARPVMHDPATDRALDATF